MGVQHDLEQQIGESGVFPSSLSMQAQPSSSTGSHEGLGFMAFSGESETCRTAQVHGSRLAKVKNHASRHYWQLSCCVNCSRAGGLQ